MRFVLFGIFIYRPAKDSLDFRRRDRACAQKLHRFACRHEDCGFDAAFAWPAVENERNAALHILEDVRCCGRAGLAAPVRAGRGDGAAERPDQHPRRRVRRHADGDG